MIKTIKLLTGVSYIFTVFMTFIAFAALFSRSIDIWYLTFMIGVAFIPCSVISGVIAFIMSCFLKDRRAKYPLMIENAIPLVVITIITIGLIYVL